MTNGKNRNPHSFGFPHSTMNRFAHLVWVVAVASTASFGLATRSEAQHPLRIPAADRRRALADAHTAVDVAVHGASASAVSVRQNAFERLGDAYLGTCHPDSARAIAASLLREVPASDVSSARFRLLAARALGTCSVGNLYPQLDRTKPERDSALALLTHAVEEAYRAGDGETAFAALIEAVPLIALGQAADTLAPVALAQVALSRARVLTLDRSMDAAPGAIARREAFLSATEARLETVRSSTMSDASAAAYQDAIARTNAAADTTLLEDLLAERAAHYRNAVMGEEGPARFESARVLLMRDRDVALAAHDTLELIRAHERLVELIGLGDQLGFRSDDDQASADIRSERALAKAAGERRFISLYSLSTFALRELNAGRVDTAEVVAAEARELASARGDSAALETIATVERMIRQVVGRASDVGYAHGDRGVLEAEVELDSLACVAVACKAKAATAEQSPTTTDFARVRAAIAHAHALPPDGSAASEIDRLRASLDAVRLQNEWTRRFPANEIPADASLAEQSYSDTLLAARAALLRWSNAPEATSVALALQAQRAVARGDTLDAIAIFRRAGALADGADPQTSALHHGTIAGSLTHLRSPTAFAEASAQLAAAADAAARARRYAGGDANRVALANAPLSANIFGLWATVETGRERPLAVLAIAERGRAQALADLRDAGRGTIEEKPLDSTRAAAIVEALDSEAGALARRALRHANAVLIHRFVPGALVTWLFTRDSVFVVDWAYDVSPQTLSDLSPPGIAFGADTSRTRRLASYLLPPRIRALLPSDGELLVVTDGTLNLVPFAALPLDGGHLLGDEHAVRVAPSLALVGDPAERPTSPGEVLVVGNPTMPRMATTDGKDRQLPSLPGSETEALAVARLFGATPLIGAAATETAVLSRMPHAALIHLATHGRAFADPETARSSFVALAPDATNDGFLTAGELLDPGGPTLTAGLVVLSACETALGDPTRSEGVVGLQRAFLARGARTLLVTLWPVSDRAAALIVRRFYAHWQGDSDRPSAAEALHRAQRELRVGVPGMESPAQWAGFQVVGAG
jgi:hypothetical protein